ncbi:MAG TPA: diacylglycerol kinase family protein [Candidatus Acidoferrum sp.]|nr:diacylglycerol kinase family protein [Candidatus Acidoferrum sp.]
MKETFLAIVNPAAGGGRASKLAGEVLSRLRAKGLAVDVIASTSAGHVAQLASEAYQQGYRRFLAVGGDGTAHEVINGGFRESTPPERIELGFLPTGTGNSFLRDFTQKDAAQHAIDAILSGRKRSIDLLRLKYAGGTVYSFNLLSVGFTADVGALTNRVFKPFGHLGYLLGVLVRVAQLKRRAFTLRCDGDKEWDERRCLLLTFNNSKFTGGTMMIAPAADPSDGQIEFVRWGPISRLGLIRMLPRLYDGTHTEHDLCETRRVTRVEFKLEGPVDLMIDGEIMTVQCQTLEIIPGAMDVYV